jgi:hypothetical protein
LQADLERPALAKSGRSDQHSSLAGWKFDDSPTGRNRPEAAVRSNAILFILLSPKPLAKAALRLLAKNTAFGGSTCRLAGKDIRLITMNAMLHYEIEKLFRKFV